jgi:hypothetical protein
MARNGVDMTRSPETKAALNHEFAFRALRILSAAFVAALALYVSYDYAISVRPPLRDLDWVTLSWIGMFAAFVLERITDAMGLERVRLLLTLLLGIGAAGNAVNLGLGIGWLLLLFAGLGVHVYMTMQHFRQVKRPDGNNPTSP